MGEIRVRAKLTNAVDEALANPAHPNQPVTKVK